MMYHRRHLKGRKYWASGVFSMLCVLFLFSCKTTQTDIGDGPITLTESTAKLYEQEYLVHSQPGIFVVPLDGSLGLFSTCEANNSSCKSHADIERLTRRCESASATKCLVFDIGGIVVWNGPVDLGESGAKKIPNLVLDRDFKVCTEHYQYLTEKLENLYQRQLPEFCSCLKSKVKKWVSWQEYLNLTYKNTNGLLGVESQTYSNFVSNCAVSTAWGL